MYEQVEKSKEKKNRAVANSVTLKNSSRKQGFGFLDNLHQAHLQRRIIERFNENECIQAMMWTQINGTWYADGDTTNPTPIHVATNGTRFDDGLDVESESESEEEYDYPNLYIANHVYSDDRFDVNWGILQNLNDGNGTSTNGQVPAENTFSHFRQGSTGVTFYYSGGKCYITDIGRKNTGKNTYNWVSGPADAYQSDNDPGEGGYSQQ